MVLNPNGQADRVLLGDVIVLDGSGRRAEALAIRDGRVMALGRRTDVAQWRGPKTDVADFGRATIIPGFNDTHAHLDTEGLKYARPSLAGARSIDDVLARIRTLAEAQPLGSWIVTMPVGEPPFYFGGPTLLAEQRMPTRAELDRAAPRHPVCILAPSGYWGGPPGYTALNSLALERNGVDRNTVPRVSGIEIAKDSAGEPTGIIIDRNFREAAEMDLLPAVPRFTVQDRRDAIRKAFGLYHATGTTSIYEGHGCSPEVIGIFRALHEAGELTMRTGLVVSPPWIGSADAEVYMRDWLGHARGAGLGDAMLRISGVFIVFDGAGAVAARDPQKLGDTGFWSHLRHTNDAGEFERLCWLAAQYDLRVHTSVSGSRLPEAVAIWERIAERFDIRSRRWVMEHVSTTRAGDLERLKRLGVAVTLIPNHQLWKNGMSFTALSEEEQDFVVPAKQLYDMGIPVSAGTDNSPCNPLSTMRAMMLRRERTSGRVIGAGGCVTAEVALRILTCEGARLTFEERDKGTLLPGYHADCAVLSGDPLRVDPRELEELDCLATMVGGVFVHGGDGDARA